MAVQNPNIVTQPHLGKPQVIYKPEEKMGGYLALAKVITMHHKNNTADVQIVKTNDILSSSAINEGRFGARICVPTAHYNESQQCSSGVIEPIQEGQLVVLAFLDGLKNQPVILGSFHNTWLDNSNILTNLYPLQPDNSVVDRREGLKYLRVFPAQNYCRVDGTGAIELSHPSKDFCIIDPDFKEVISDAHDTFDHRDLSEKDMFTQQTIGGHTEEAMLPIKYLFVHRTSFDDLYATWTKVFLDKTGLFRLSRDNNDNTLTYMQISEEGDFRVKRQCTSNIKDEDDKYTSVDLNSDSTFNLLKKNGEESLQININDTQELLITRNNSECSIKMSSDNSILLSNESGSYIKLMSNGDIVIKGKTVDIQADSFQHP